MLELINSSCSEVNINEEAAEKTVSLLLTLCFNNLVLSGDGFPEFVAFKFMKNPGFSVDVSKISAIGIEDFFNALLRSNSTSELFFM